MTEEDQEIEDISGLTDAQVRTMVRVKPLGAATFLLSFALLAAAPFHARAWEESPVPPQPIPHVTHTTAVHLPAAAPSLPLPRSRPALMAPSPPLPPKKTLVQIND